MRLVLAATVAVLPALMAFGHADHAVGNEDVVKARRAYFTLFGANIGPLAAMAKGEAPYNAADAQGHADNFGALVAYNPGPHFQPGTSNAEMPGKTRALPSIWNDFGGFQQKIADFDAAVANLQAEAGKGRGALGPALGRLGGTCKGCHDDYRAKDF